MPSDDHVVLVDDADRPTGTAEKMRAHQAGARHRALSVFVFNGCGALLLQQRAHSKYHSPGLWSNTCCSHPRPGEEVLAAAHRRLEEEMGFDCPLRQVTAFAYREEFANGLIEHEYDHVLVGRWEGQPIPNADEVAAWRWEPLADLGEDVRSQPERYTVWLGRAMEALLGSGAVSPSGAIAVEG